MNSETYIEEFIARARKAQAIYQTFTQEQVDNIVQAVGKSVFDNAEELAALAVEETKMGLFQDKVSKNKNKSRLIWNSLKGKKSMGVISKDAKSGITKIAKPVGVVAAVTPMTNPIVTPMSNIMFALKSGNAIIVTPHHKAKYCSSKTVYYINEAIKKLKAPESIVQILDIHSRENTKNLISKCDITIATGGMGMVKAAYSSGKPALGVGAGNVQCIIDNDVNMEKAIPMIVKGRTFDNGIICSSEQSIIVAGNRFEEALKILKNNSTLVLTEKEDVLKIRNAVFNKEGHMNPQLVGQSASSVGKHAGIDIPPDMKMIAVLADGPGKEDMFSKEKMCPVISLYRTRDFKDSVETARLNLEEEGKGHSVCIHSNSKDNIEYAGKRLSVSRFILNQSCASAAGGSFYNGLSPTNTLGCGSWGNNSISENLTYYHLLNISRIAEYMPLNYVPSDEELWE